MNLINKNIKKMLTVVNSDDYLEDLYKICLRKVQNGSLVLMLTCRKFDISRLSPMKKMQITKEQMKRLIVINYMSIDEITQKLLDLHDWSLLPALVVIDLAAVSITPSTSLLKTICLCGATFCDYLHSIAMQMENKLKSRSLHVYGVFIVREENQYFNQHHLEMLRNLYFYSDDMVDNIWDIERFLENDCL
ncbi:uncharacterized protein [Musca autumnalis]|uniref:uncharacterized protein n=1 Tax=Musca autumnalis TaxID=221902 RepID=UPI003CF4E9DE